MSNKNLGKPLTMDLVFTKTKSDSLQNIKNLNLWGNDLEDLKLIEKMPNLEVVSLSVNKIHSLKDFSSCSKLQELYLRKNNIADLKEIKHLIKLPSLKVLWLHDNPCAQIENYRQIVIKCLPNLAKLDNHPVTPEQRTNSQKINYNLGSISQEQQYEKERPRSQYEQERWQRPQSSHNASNMHKNQNPSYGNYGNYNQEKVGVSEEKWAKRSSHSQQQQQPPQHNQSKKDHYPKEEEITRNQNILMAILSLMRELDPGSLEIVRRQTDKLLQ